MGPRHGGRGKQTAQTRAARELGASMGPRHGGRGKVTLTVGYKGVINTLQWGRATGGARKADA